MERGLFAHILLSNPHETNFPANRLSLNINKDSYASN
jgi:hypothetical protein